MTRREAPKSAPRQIAADKRDRQDKVTSSGDLERRRSRREADKLLRALREQLAGYDAGEIEFATFACTADVIASLMADIALRGEMVA